MTLKHLNRPVDERSETSSNGRVDGQKMMDIPTTQSARPTALQVFHARFERNRPGYQFLADH